MDAVTLMVIAFILLVILNVPVAFAMGSATALALYLSGGLPLQMVPQKLASGIESFPFLAIPLFILTGGLMETGGISRRLVEFAQSLVGHIRGGLGLVMVDAEMFFSGFVRIENSFIIPCSIRGYFWQRPLRVSRLNLAILHLRFSFDK